MYALDTYIQLFKEMGQFKCFGTFKIQNTEIHKRGGQTINSSSDGISQSLRLLMRIVWHVPHDLMSLF